MMIYHAPGGMDIPLNKGAKQSDGSVLTPFQQARRYAAEQAENKAA